MLSRSGNARVQKQLNHQNLHLDSRRLLAIGDFSLVCNILCVCIHKPIRQWITIKFVPTLLADSEASKVRDAICGSGQKAGQLAPVSMPTLAMYQWESIVL
jgi:hypothetical protein